MASDDGEHFDDYREQTKVKHEILAAYLPAYFSILGTRNATLNYVDGFAGRGTYTNAKTGQKIDGSPIRALKLIAENEQFTETVSTLFVEAREDHYAEMRSSVIEFYKSHPKIRKPWTLNTTFEAGVEELLDELEAGDQLAPTFVFVDPCGVAGNSFAAIQKIMGFKSSEAFIFFNMAGVKRVAGLKPLSPVLVAAYGTKERAQAVVDEFNKTGRSHRREELLLQHYRDALHQDMGVKYTIPFRIEAEDKKVTSHYLIHASNHHRGFAIMKDVMWKRGRSVEGTGALQFAQASHLGYTALFDPQQNEKDDILEELAKGKRRVSLFYEDWVYRPEDLRCESSYRKALLELEKDGEIEVLAKDGKVPMPASSRPTRNKSPTLGKDYFVRLQG